MIWESLFTYETETSKLRNRGHRSSLPGAHAVDVAAATRLRGPPLLSAPTPSSAALLRLPDAVTTRFLISFCLCAHAQTICSPAASGSRRQSTSQRGASVRPTTRICCLSSSYSTSSSEERGAARTFRLHRLFGEVQIMSQYKQGFCSTSFNFLSGEDVVRSSPGMVPMAAAQ